MANILSTTISNACVIHCLSGKNYDVLWKGPFSHIMSKVHKMIGPTMSIRKAIDVFLMTCW